MTAAKNAWLQCPEANKHRMRPEMERLCSAVATKFGTATGSAARDAALLAIQPHITANADRPGVNWTSVALQVAATPAFPLTAYAALQSVTDAASFRRGIHQLCQPTCLTTSADFRLLQDKVQQLLPLAPDSTNCDWFLAGLTAPPPPGHAAAPPITQHPQPPSAPLATALHTPSLLATAPSQAATITAQSPPTVRITGLHSKDQESMAAALTLTLGTPVYVTPHDSRRGWGIAVVSAAVHASLFAAHQQRQLQHPDGWELTLSGKNSPGEPWRVGPSALTELPSRRPEHSQPAKRAKTEQTSSPLRRSPRLQGRAQHVHPSAHKGRAVRGDMWPAHRGRK